MNITTTREFALVASASEKGLPSIVVREKAGAFAPMLGAGVSAAAAPESRTARHAAASTERTFIGFISSTHPQEADGEKNSPRPRVSPGDRSLRRAAP